jgi:hypothetical protein
MKLRRLIMRFMPNSVKKAAETESRSWIGACSHCGAEMSIWDIGGIRFGGGGAPSTRINCRSCSKFSFVTFRKRIS